MLSHLKHHLLSVFKLFIKVESKSLSEEALQIAEKRREEKGKEEKKQYTHLNSEFQRIAKKRYKSPPQ